MLGDELNSLKKGNQQKSSILMESMDQKRLTNLIEDKDRTIRKLTKRIEKLQETLKRTLKEKGLKDKNTEVEEGGNVHLQLLKAQIEKTQKLQNIIEDITDRIHMILEDLSHDNTITDNTQQIRMVLNQLGASKLQNQSFDYFEYEQQKSLNISTQWAKKIDLLEGAFKSFKIKITSLRQINHTLTIDNQNMKVHVANIKGKHKNDQQIKQLVEQLKEEKKQKEKFKKLLQKAEFQKNQLINKINLMGKETDVKAKTKEQLLQYSKELHYRVKDLEKEKQAIIKESTKDKQEDLKKYQQFLKKLKVIKEKSILGKSCQ